MQTAKTKSLKLLGGTGDLLQKITDRWLLSIRETNPAILDMFRDRDVRPYRDLLPWSGEFAGKYLTGAYYVYRATGREDLKAYALDFIDRLLSHQDTDGYLGCFPRECRLTGSDAAGRGTWDAWNHYHWMFALLLWQEETGNEALLAAVEKTAALFLVKFYTGEKRLNEIGSTEMNLSVYHVFGLLARKTGKEAYLTFAREIEKDLESEGDYLRVALAGTEFYAGPKPRWESMHVIMGYAELYRATGEEKYLTALRQIVHSILKTDVHNTGAFSTSEQAVGTPFINAPIETCCVIAFNALVIELWKLTGEDALLDFLERAHCNAMLGCWSPSGRWSTYDTPMDGVKRANYDSIQFQCRPGSPDLNCCSANAPRGVSNLTEWMLAEEGDVTYLNWYEPFEAVLADGLAVAVEGNYRAKGEVTLFLSGGEKERTLSLRVPGWSKRTSVRVNGSEAEEVNASRYVLRFTGDCRVELRFDMTPWILHGEAADGTSTRLPPWHENGWPPEIRVGCPDMVSVFCGPILYGAEAGENPGQAFEKLAISAAALERAVPETDASDALHLRVGELLLTDFAHLGWSGSEYRTWLGEN